MGNEELDQEEQELLETYEAGVFVSTLTKERQAYLANVVDASLRKDAKINVRISRRDLAALQRRALEEGLPYQALVASVLHKYLSGSFKDVSGP